MGPIPKGSRQAIRYNLWTDHKGRMKLNTMQLLFRLIYGLENTEGETARNLRQGCACIDGNGIHSPIIPRLWQTKSPVYFRIACVV